MTDAAYTGPALNSAEQRAVDIKPGLAHLCELVAQRPRTDAQALGGFLAPAAFGTQGVENEPIFAVAQIIIQCAGWLSVSPHAGMAGLPCASPGRSINRSAASITPPCCKISAR